MDKNKKIMLVTGGSRGIGAATSLLAARHDYAVAVNYVNDSDAADSIVEQIVANGGTAVALQADVANESEVENMFEQLDDRLGRVTTLVNNAGILAPLSKLKNFDSKRMQRIFSVNVIGSFLCAREAVKRMSTANGGDGGCIVNISSGAARLGGANQYIDYASSKGAIDTLTIGLARGSCL